MTVQTAHFHSIFVVLAAVLGLIAPHAANAGGPDRNDPELVEIVAQDYQSVEELLNALEALEGVLVERGDPRAIFTAAYRVLTSHAMADLEAGAFEDPGWAASLTVAFGNFYRQAFLDYETGNDAAVPPAWRVAFDAAERDSVTLFQHLLLGVHAHVNRDLPYAIAAITPRNERGIRFRDYVVTNELVLGAIYDVEQLVGTEFAPVLGNLDEALGELDAELLRALLSHWRVRAWRNAQFFDGGLPPYYEFLLAWFVDVQTGYMARAIAIGGR